MTTSTHSALVFKMIVKQKKINVKTFPSKEKFSKVKQLPSVFGAYSLVATVFDNFLI